MELGYSVAIYLFLFIFIKTLSVGENRHAQMDKQVHTNHIKKLSAVGQS